MKYNKVYPFQVGTEGKPKEVFMRINQQADKEVFKEDIRLSHEVVFSCLLHLQELAINNIDLATQGIVFEKFIQDFFKSKMGQFFTLRNIVPFSVTMMNE